MLSLTQWADRVARNEPVAERLVIERRADGSLVRALRWAFVCLGFYPACICHQKRGQQTMLAKLSTKTPGENSQQLLPFNLAAGAGGLLVLLTAAKAGPVVFDMMTGR